MKMSMDIESRSSRASLKEMTMYNQEKTKQRQNPELLEGLSQGKGLSFVALCYKTGYNRLKLQDNRYQLSVRSICGKGGIQVP